MSIVQSGHYPVGVHILINLYDIFDTELLKFLSRGKLALFEIADILKLNVVNNIGHQFLPFGYTFTLVLAESHLTIHTYPEYNSCYLDIFCCSPDFNPDRAVSVIKDVFLTKNSTHYIIKR
jgi:S-adenosylmethionine decarboxylase proenzyme